MSKKNRIRNYAGYGFAEGVLPMSTDLHVPLRTYAKTWAKKL
jgi:hypothetical protein